MMEGNFKTVLISGATQGIGLETASQLGLLGHYIIISGRNEEAGKTALSQLQSKNIKCDFVLMDIQSMESINAAYDLVKTKFNSINVLINSAAILIDSAENFLIPDESAAKKTFETNLLGPLFTTQVFLPLIKPGASIINVSSGGGSMTDAPGGWAPLYCISKTALNSLTRQLAHALQNRNIKVNAVCPGWVRTRMGGTSAPLPLAKGAETVIWLATDAPHVTGRFFRNKKEIPW